MPAHLSHDPQCENVHFVGSYFLEHLGILKYDGTVAGGWGGSGVGEVGYCVPLFGHQLHSDPCSSDVSQHGNQRSDFCDHQNTLLQ